MTAPWRVPSMTFLEHARLCLECKVIAAHRDLCVLCQSPRLVSVAEIIRPEALVTLGRVT